MGLALSRREANPGNTLNDPADRAGEEARLASLAYLAWPVALYERVAPRKNASNWYRLSMQRALWFGNLAVLAALVALAWPMLASLFVTDVTATLWVYGFAMTLDAALLIAWIVLALRYSRRAAEGELFEVPLVARFTGSGSGKRQ